MADNSLQKTAETAGRALGFRHRPLGLVHLMNDDNGCRPVLDMEYGICYSDYRSLSLKTL